MLADATRSIKLVSLKRSGLAAVLTVLLTVPAVSGLRYMEEARELSASAMELGLGVVAALVVMAFVVIALRSAPRRLVIEEDRVTLEGWSGKSVADASRAEVLATPGVFFESTFWSDSTIESDSPMLTLHFGMRVVTIMLWGGVSGWPRGPIVKGRPHYRVNEEDFLWLAETLCAPASIAEVDFTERMTNSV